MLLRTDYAPYRVRLLHSVNQTVYSKTVTY